MQTILTNSIICGDCRDKMKQHIPSESVDLIYMDPPFFSGKNYEVIWKDGAEVRSFEDTEFYTLECECGKVFPENHLYCAFCGAGKDNAKERRSNDIEAYLQWLRPKLEECYRVLKSTGSIYVHLDWHAVHYVKVMLDEIFGYKNLQNEIVWCHYGGGQSKSFFPRKHDNILVYNKGKTHTFNTDDIRVPYDSNYKGTSFKGKNTRAPGKVYTPNKKGKLPEDFWIIARPYGKEHIGYPTQKPEALLERIIKASSNPGDIVLDPFSGCATCISVAQKLGRRWIGIDVSPTSCKLMTDRLRKIGYSIGESDIIDMPYTLKGLRELPPFEFQNWAVQQLGGRQEVRKSGDGGIDGWTFAGDPIQVKQHKNNTGAPDVSAFTHAIQKVKKTKGVFVAFGYSKGAIDEVSISKNMFGIDIELKTVEDML